MLGQDSAIGGEERGDRGDMRTLGLRCAPSSRSVLVESESNNAGAGDRR